jgi:hypothetical protein
MALLKEAGEIFNETGCVPGIDGEQVPAERIVPDAIFPTGRQDMAEVVGTPLAQEGVPLSEILADLSAQYILEAIDNAEAMYDPEIWDTPGFTLVLSWLVQKWQQRCDSLAHRRRVAVNVADDFDARP